MVSLFETSLRFLQVERDDSCVWARCGYNTYGLLQGVKWPPSKKHDFGKFPVCWTMLVSNLNDGPPGEKTALFSKKRREHGPTNRELPEKMVKNRGTLFMDHF